MPLSIIFQKSYGVALLIIGGLLAYQFAVLSWSFFPAEKTEYQWHPPKAGVSASLVNTQKLQQQHLFGEAISKQSVAKPSKRVSIAPKTKLKVVLVGVVAASEPKYSSAIISYKSKQGSYFIDSKIPGTSAVVSEIYVDRVILDVDGVLQTLMLDGIDTAKSSNNKRTQVTKKTRDDKPVQVEIDRKALLDDPSKLTDYIRISPYRKDGQVLGYTLKPGKDKTLFDEAGFKKGDLAVELNGIDLTDTQEAFILMKELPTMTDINVTVERGDQLYELSLNIP